VHGASMLYLGSLKGLNPTFIQRTCLSRAPNSSQDQTTHRPCARSINPTLRIYRERLYEDAVHVAMENSRPFHASLSTAAIFSAYNCESFAVSPFLKSGKIMTGDSTYPTLMWQSLVDWISVGVIPAGFHSLLCLQTVLGRNCGRSRVSRNDSTG
jgi:hypothetical protein